MSDSARVQYYLELLNEITNYISDPQIAVQILKEIAKDRRMSELHSVRDGNSDEEPAGLHYLKRLGVNVGLGLTRAEALRKIDAIMSESDSMRVGPVYQLKRRVP